MPGLSDALRALPNAENGPVPELRRISRRRDRSEETYFTMSMTGAPDARGGDREAERSRIRVGDYNTEVVLRVIIKYIVTKVGF